MASIYCYSYAEPTLNLLGVVDDFISFNFTRSYSGIGEWQLVLDGSTLNAQRVKGMNFISLGKDVAGYVAKCEDNTTAGVNTVTFTGVELKGLTQRRIIIPPTGQAYQHYAGKSPEYIIAELLNLQLLNPTDIDRQIVGSLEPYDTEHSGITYDGRYQVLADEIVELATAYNIGWCASIEDGAIVWRIWNGVNRTAGQTENNRMILDYEYGTMNDSTLTTAEGVPTFMIVAGQGEGAERAIETLNNGKAKLERQETFLDARDIEDDSLLAQRGEEKLAEYGDNTSYTATLSNQAVKQYRTDFDLGDIGTIREAKIEGSLDYRITEVEEVYEGNQVSINVVFGYEKSQLVDAIKRMNSKRDALLAVEGYGSGSGSSGGGCDCEPITTSSDGAGNVVVGGGCVTVTEGGTTESGVDKAYVDYKIAVSLEPYATKESVAAITPASIGAAEITHNHLCYTDGNIESNDDLNNYWYVCVKFVGTNAEAKTIANMPCAFAGRLICFDGNNAHRTELNGSIWGNFLQIYISYQGDVYRRTGNTDGSGVVSYGNWVKFSTTAV